MGRIKQAAERGMDAFWAAVAAEFPDSAAGDVDDVDPVDALRADAVVIPPGAWRA